MVNYKNKSLLWDQLFSELRYPPTKHLVYVRLADFEHPEVFDGFVFDLNRNVVETPFLETKDLRVTKIDLTSDLRFYREGDPLFNFNLPGFTMQIYMVKKEGYGLFKGYGFVVFGGTCALS